MSIEKNRLLMETQVKRLRGELNEAELKPGMKITSIKDVGYGDYALLVVDGQEWWVATGGGASLTYEGDWQPGQKFKPGVIKSIKTPWDSNIEIHLKDGRMIEFVDDTGGEGVDYGKNDGPHKYK